MILHTIKYSSLKSISWFKFQAGKSLKSNIESRIYKKNTTKNLEDAKKCQKKLEDTFKKKTLHWLPSGKLIPNIELYSHYVPMVYPIINH